MVNRVLLKKLWRDLIHRKGALSASVRDSATTATIVWRISTLT